jgi:hypothetical protein
VEVLRSGSVSVAGKLGTGSDLPVTSCLLDLLPSVKSAGEEIRTAVDCSSLESASPGLLDKDRSFCTLGKKTLVPSILNFERSKRNTWSKLGPVFLEVAVFGLGGRKCLIFFPEGRGGWGWLKFSEELRNVAVCLFAKVGCEHGSPPASFKSGGKEEEAKIGLAPH